MQQTCWQPPSVQCPGQLHPIIAPDSRFPIDGDSLWPLGMSNFYFFQQNRFCFEIFSFEMVNFIFTPHSKPALKNSFKKIKKVCFLLDMSKILGLNFGLTRFGPIQYKFQLVFGLVRLCPKEIYIYYRFCTELFRPSWKIYFWGLVGY